MLLGETNADQLMTARAVREDPDVAPARISRLSALCGLFDQIWRQCSTGKAAKAVTSGPASLEHLGPLREAHPEFASITRASWAATSSTRGLGEDRAHHGRHEGLGLFATRQSRLRHEVGAATVASLPGRQRVDRLGEASVVVADDQLHAGEAAGR